MVGSRYFSARSGDHLRPIGDQRVSRHEQRAGSLLGRSLEGALEVLWDSNLHALDLQAHCSG
jgi:hypothetical protein